MFDLRSLARRPEFSALAATLFVYMFFMWAGWPTFSTGPGTANWLNFGAQLGLIALPVSLVMISGHLDLSVGSNLAAGAMSYAILSGHYSLPDWIGVVAGLVVGAFIGLVNGVLVTRTKLPSFIVTLAMLFALRGIVFGVTRLTTSTVLVAIDVDPQVKTVLGSRMFSTYQTAILFWVGMAVVVSWILYRSTFGNWIFAIGGDETSARAAGVPVERTTVWLFVFSGFGAALVGVIQVALFSSAQVSAGQSYVFWSIIAVVVGGVLLTGGYGSPIGVILGTLTFAIVYQGIFSTGWDSDWSSLILGVLLLFAVLSNNTFRRLALSGGKATTKVGGTKALRLPEPAIETAIQTEEQTNV